jgi:hypothetical protein
MMAASDHLSQAQFWFHGTSTAASQHGPGDLIDPGQPHDRTFNVSMRNHVYFTSDPNRASFYADKAVAKFGGKPRVLQVEPTGEYGQDFQTRRAPENQMSRHPLRVISEQPYTDWRRTHYER